MRAHENVNDAVSFTRESRPSGLKWLTVLSAGAALSGAIAPPPAAAQVELVVVDASLQISDRGQAHRAAGRDEGAFERAFKSSSTDKATREYVT